MFFQVRYPAKLVTFLIVSLSFLGHEQRERLVLENHDEVAQASKELPGTLGDEMDAKERTRQR